MRSITGSGAIKARRQLAGQPDSACPALLQTSYSAWQGELTDVTAGDAVFWAINPPKVGATALVIWSTFESLCEVAWTRGDQCGLRFEKQILGLAADPSVISSEKLEHSASLGKIPTGEKRSLGNSIAELLQLAGDPLEAGDEVPGPAAELENIPLGKKRSRTSGETVVVDHGPQPETLAASQESHNLFETDSHNDTGELASIDPAGESELIVVFGRPSKRRTSLGPENMTTSELMFFYEAPVAHIVTYERHCLARQDDA